MGAARDVERAPRSAGKRLSEGSVDRGSAIACRRRGWRPDGAQSARGERRGEAVEGGERRRKGARDEERAKAGGGRAWRARKRGREARGDLSVTKESEV